MNLMINEVTFLRAFCDRLLSNTYFNLMNSSLTIVLRLCYLLADHKYSSNHIIINFLFVIYLLFIFLTGLSILYIILFLIVWLKPIIEMMLQASICLVKIATTNSSDCVHKIHYFKGFFSLVSF